MLLVFAIPPFSNWALHLTGVHPSPIQHWAVAFFGTLLLLLPATAAMGATLPAMERILAWHARHGRTRSIAALYAANTMVRYSACSGPLRALPRTWTGNGPRLARRVSHGE